MPDAYQVGRYAVVAGGALVNLPTGAGTAYARPLRRHCCFSLPLACTASLSFIEGWVAYEYCVCPMLLKAAVVAAASVAAAASVRITSQVPCCLL